MTEVELTKLLITELCPDNEEEIDGTDGGSDVVMVWASSDGDVALLPALLAESTTADEEAIASEDVLATEDSAADEDAIADDDATADTTRSQVMRLKMRAQLQMQK